MRIRVEHENGRIEALTLRGTWHCVEGKYLNRLVDENGFEHFFTPDGHYDGWGGRVRESRRRKIKDD